MKKVSNDNQTISQTVFATQDDMLVAALRSNGIEPIAIARLMDNGDNYFSFEDSKRTQKLVKKYEDGTLRVGLDYFDLVCDAKLPAFDL